MAPFDPTLPTRLVICVDGTQQSASSSIQTNIHRIYSAIKRGRSHDTKTANFNQAVQYFPGIGLADDAFSKDRLTASVFGSGYLKQIQDVYESCCKLDGDRDEVWLLGYSRGGYVVRAVAGLLHHVGAVATAGQPEFAKDFKKVLKDAEKSQGLSGLALSPVSSAASTHARASPSIQFVGVFDTIQAMNDSAVFDISFNRSIKHMRQALALHEERKALSPESIFPDELYGTDLRDYGRSFVQAHFIGDHVDMGGSAKRSGLGLYPLQWMVLEAKQCGLNIDLEGGDSGHLGIHNPLSVVFPKSRKKRADNPIWTCKTANGIPLTMQDLRDVHEIVRLNENYAVKLDSRAGSIRQKKTREPFTNDGLLRGYCDWAPQGTIIHCSVYLLLDEHINVSLETKELRLQRNIEDWRQKMLGSEDGHMNTGFWLDDDEDDVPNPGAIRVLVCGNTGVGKSTLINKTFGVDVTQSSNRTRGIHNVQEEITFEGRPDLVVHDSGGFEAGTDDEFKAIEAFLIEKSAQVNIEDRLHVIWFCVDINSARTLQTATEKLFQAVSQYAEDVPIVVVATKKDDFLDIEFSAHRRALKKEGKKFDEEACEQYAEERLKERIETIQNEMETVPGGRLDACVAVSQDDDSSVSNLSKTTARCFDIDKVRLLYIRAQTSRIDLKVELALAEVMKRYKKLIRSATGSSFAPGGATITRRVTTAQVTKAIINCFGLPTMTANAAMEALKANVWRTMGANATLALADALSIIGLTGTVFAAGIPAYLVTGTINSSYVVPTTCRLFLMMATDLTFVLARSFKEMSLRTKGQPTERDVGAAARNYAVRGYAQHVHRDIKKLVPRRNTFASYKSNTIQHGLDSIFEKYKDKLMENVDLPLKIQGMKVGSELDDDDTSTEADSLLYTDFKHAQEALVELEAKAPAAELDASSPVAELSADGKVVELDSVATGPKRVELEGSNAYVKR